ncbi:MAG: recombinase family protein [Methylococcaceae bacterium]|jgi:DNA invertase Pin-like site-specific DNA recombinase
MRLGYARVSTQEQDNQLQITALKENGYELIFQKKVSGGRWDRPELHRLLGQLGKGDIVTVWKLDRLSRSVKDLFVTLDKIEEAGANLQSLTEAIDTSTPTGRMMMQIVGSFAEFERALLRERTKNGLEAARQEGRIEGRRPKLTPLQQKQIISLVTSGQKKAPMLLGYFRFILRP